MDFRKCFGALAVTALFSSAIGNGVNAYSDSTTYNIPRVAGHSIKSDCWFEHKGAWSPQQFKVSAKLIGGKPSQQIKTSWDFEATGIGVSVSGVGACIGGNKYGSYLTNTKGQKIASHSGSFKLSGLPMWGRLANTASVKVAGVSASASASCSRFY